MIEYGISDLLYSELKALARHRFCGERKDHTLQPTALANETWLRLRKANIIPDQTAQYFGAAANSMRQILIDHARARNSQKRGGSAIRIPVDPANLVTRTDVLSTESALSMRQSLARLKALDPRQAQIVELRFFGGLDDSQIASLLNISARTVRREWLIARLWLKAALA